MKKEERKRRKVWQRNTTPDGILNCHTIKPGIS